MRHYSRFVIVSAFLVFSRIGLSAGTEAPVVEWSRTSGGDDVEFGAAARETSDGGFVIGGATMSYGAGYLDVFLFKTDADGDLVWSKTFGGPDTDTAAAVLPTEDGGFIVAGATASMGAGFHNALLLKVDASGDAMWSRAFGGDGHDNADAMEPTNDGGYVLAGFTESFGAPGRNMYVVKTDAEGRESWSGVFGGEEEDAAAAVCQTADGGYIVAGYSRSPSTEEPRRVAELDAARPAGG